MSLTQERRADENPLKREQLQGSIEFRDVDFSYPEQQNLSLHKINLTIQPGERIGIIGRSGSGKSSLSKLIVNLYQPSAGNLLIDGIDSRQLDVNDLRHSIGYVPQDIQLFNGTLRDNLLCGARYVDDETMLRAAELAGVNEFARLHPDGYNLQVGERGSQLSGGQRQAVALARALLLDPHSCYWTNPPVRWTTPAKRRSNTRWPLYRGKNVITGHTPCFHAVAG